MNSPTSEEVTEESPSATSAVDSEVTRHIGHAVVHTFSDPNDFTRMREAK
jgi:hypothetical protein